MLKGSIEDVVGLWSGKIVIRVCRQGELAAGAEVARSKLPNCTCLMLPLPVFWADHAVLTGDGAPQDYPE